MSGWAMERGMPDDPEETLLDYGLFKGSALDEGTKYVLGIDDDIALWCPVPLMGESEEWLAHVRVHSEG
ncbi:hypothetical protein NDU88_003594 [Pleurodeles waltl]|uniref:Uncharacterized protein n=1 Tax=Pleurodeles waltl TaxID=8319 RepID=A0AAV7TPL0_PLEWA|nr:hypothetical protein NDU88_003594 [Pleurodeles waltl]